MYIPSDMLPAIINHLDAGVVVIDRQFEIVLWNRYMATHSKKESDDVIGQNIFDLFPDLPRQWLSKKIHSVCVLNTASFSSWEQRPWLFKFPHNRPVTGGVDWMHQNCVFTPLKNPVTQEVERVCITIFDVTDSAIRQLQLTRAMEELERLSTTDSLTQIHNRQFLQVAFRNEFVKFQRKGTHASVLLMDLDFFKKVNDTYGHVCGDLVLKTFAARARETMREEDIFGRYGGEEFAVVLPQTNEEGASFLAERIRKRIAAEPVIFDGHEIQATVSIGVADLSHGFESEVRWLQAADDALYASKKKGRNCATLYSYLKTQTP